MEVLKIKLFIYICVLCAALDCLPLKEVELICLLEECLAVALLLKNVDTESISYRLLGKLYEQIYQIRKAMEYYEKHLQIANEMGDGNKQFAAYEDLGNASRLLGNYHESTKYHEKSLNIAKDNGYKKGQAAAYVNLGINCQLLGDYQKAIQYQKKSLDIALGIGDRKGEASAYENLGITLHSLGKYQNATKYQEKLLDIAIKILDRTREAAACSNLGIIYQSLGNYQKAVEYQEKSLDIALCVCDRKAEASAYGNLGNANWSLGEIHKALDYYGKALKIAMEIGDRKGEGTAYRNLGIVYAESLGKYPEAINYREKSLSIAKQIGERKIEVALYGNIVNTHRSSGKYQKAIEYYEKSLNIAVEIGDRQGESNAYGNLGINYGSLGKYYRAKECQEKRLKIAMDMGDSKGQAHAHGSLGNVCYLLGKYQKAIKYYWKSLTVAMEINDKSGEGAVYANMGNIYQRLGKHHEAKQYYEKRLSIAVELGDRAGEGAAYGNIGNNYKLLGNYHEAIEYHKESLDIAVEISDRHGEGTAYGNLGVASQSLGKYHEAIKYQEKSLRIAKEIGDRRGEGAANGFIGNTYQSLKQYQEAIEYHNKHLSIAIEIADREGQGQAHFNIGSCYRSMAIQQDSDQPTNLKEAETHFKKSIQSFESIFDDLEQDEYKILIVDTFIEAYKRLAHVYVQTQQMEEALLVSDRGRARSLRDLLTLKYGINNKPTSKSGSIDMTDIEMILSTNNFNILFYALQREDLAYLWVLAHQSQLYFHPSEFKGFESSRVHPSLTEDNSEEIHEKSILYLVKKSYEKIKFREGMKCEDRSLGLIKVEYQDIEEEPVSSQVAEQNNSVGREIGKEVNQTDARCIYDGDHDYDDISLELLYDALIAPVQHMLVHDEIVIIPDGDLYMVPFAALQDPKTGKFLSETKSIRLAPSLMTIKVLQQSSDDQHYKSGALIVGNPEIGKVKFEGRERSFSNLPGAEDEAKEIAKLLGVEPLIGRQATKEAVVQKLQVGVSVIHFAAHGSENGQILLAPSTSSATNSIPDEQDFILTIQEAQESGIRAQLVVLSCCHSGRGEIKAEGVVGMTRAFLAAGARAVVASLWVIDDDATKVFMLKFYSHLKRGESASKSLQQAMKEMRETETYKEPRYWAAFFLIGDDVTISV